MNATNRRYTSAIQRSERDRAETTAFLLGIMLLVSVSTLTAAYGQRFPSDGTGGPGSSSRMPDMPRVPDSPTPHIRLFTPESHVPFRSPDLGSAYAPLSPSIGPGSSSLGPEAGPDASRRRPDTDQDSSDGAERRRGR